MKKTLSVLAVLGFVSFLGMQSAEAFSWSSLNPAYWGKGCPCETKKKDCGCKKQKKCDPCHKEEICPGAAAPVQCDPCQKKVAPCDPCNKEVTQPKPCDACDRLQQMNK